MATFRCGILAKIAPREDPGREKYFTAALLSKNRFPWKLYHIVSECRTGSIGWDASGQSVFVRPQQFKREWLDPPTSAFKTTNFGSFVRQLNLYGFRKVQSSKFVSIDNFVMGGGGLSVCKFHNSLFVRGRPDLLGQLVRNVGARKTKKSFSKENCGEDQSEESRHVQDFTMSECHVETVAFTQSSLAFDDAVESSCSWLQYEADEAAEFNQLDLPVMSPVEAADLFLSKCTSNFISQQPCVNASEGEFTMECTDEENERQNSLLQKDEDDNKHESEDITIMTKAEFDEMVSVFTQMLHYDPETLVTSLSEIDNNLGSYAQRLLQKFQIFGRSESFRPEES